MVHSVVKMTPSEARKEKNQQGQDEFRITVGSNRSRVYPELTEGDHVKTMRKNGISGTKHSSHWFRETFATTKIETRLGQNCYYVNGRPSPLLKHEPLEV